MITTHHRFIRPGCITVEMASDAATEAEALQDMIDAAQERLDALKRPTLESVVEGWKARGGRVVHGVDLTEFYGPDGDLVALWDAVREKVGTPKIVWRAATLTDLAGSLPEVP